MSSPNGPIENDQQSASEDNSIEMTNEIGTDTKTFLYNELNSLETFNDLNEYWRVNHLIYQQETETKEENAIEVDEYQAIRDPNLVSHIRFHLREEIDVRNFEWLKSSSNQSQIDNYNEMINRPNNKYSILIATDFTFPKFGGVETHGYQLSQCLISRGHKVTFLTNNFAN